MKKIRLFVFVILLSLMIAIGLAGCATAPVKLSPVAGAKLDFSKYDTLVVEVSKAEGVEMSEEDISRMSNKIIEVLRKHYGERFQVVGNNSGNPEVSPAELVLGVKFTKFQKFVIGFPVDKIPEFKADIVLKRGDILLSTGFVHAVGQKALYGGDIPAGPIRSWGLLLNPYWVQPLTEQKFAEKLAKSLPDGL